jgi:hypothetical protein
MKAVLIVGAPHTLYDSVFRESGLALANPSRYDGRTPQELQGLILGSHDTHLEKPGSLISLKPGKLWSELAADLFMANINLPSWGWADHQTAPLIDFWADFESQLRFVICYDEPQAYLANALAAVPDPDGELVDGVLAEWTRWNTFLLNRFLEHRNRCILVNTQEVFRNPGRLLELAGLEGGPDTHLSTNSAGAPAAAGLAHFVARAFIPADHIVWALSKKLDKDAQIPGPAHVSPTSTLRAAWGTWVEVRAQLELDRDRIEGIERSALEAVAERDRLAEELRQLRAEQQSSSQSASLKERDELAQQIASLAATIKNGAGESVRAAELVLENEHLVAALHQVQQELEAHVQGRLVPDPAVGIAVVEELHSTVPVDTVELDMRSDIAGENWYEAEDDGRWAGPGLRSSIRLPAMKPGTYTLELSLADAIEPDVVYGLRMEALGADVPFELPHAVGRDSFPIVCRAVLDFPSSAAPGPWALALTFPRTVSPASNGSSDHRHLAIRVKGLKLHPAGNV